LPGIVETTPVAMLKMVVDMTAGIDATAHLIINASPLSIRRGRTGFQQFTGFCDSLNSYNCAELAGSIF